MKKPWFILYLHFFPMKRSTTICLPKYYSPSIRHCICWHQLTELLSASFEIRPSAHFINHRRLVKNRRPCYDKTRSGSQQTISGVARRLLCLFWEGRELFTTPCIAPLHPVNTVQRTPWGVAAGTRLRHTFVTIKTRSAKRIAQVHFCGSDAGLKRARCSRTNIFRFYMIRVFFASIAIIIGARAILDGAGGTNTFKWWSGSLKFGFRLHRHSLWRKRVLPLL